MPFPVSLRNRLFLLLTFFAMAAIAHGAPGAPTNCVAAGTGNSVGGASIAISWQDNSTNEIQWIVQIDLDDGLGYRNLSIFASSTPASTGQYYALPWSNGVKGSTYRFRVWAFDGAQYSVSNEASVTPATFSAAASAVPNQVVVNLTWSAVPNAGGFEIWGGSQGGNLTFLKAVAGSATGGQVAAPTVAAGSSYQFVVKPYLGNQYIGTSSLLPVALNVITSKTGTSGTAGSPLSHTFTQTTVASVSSRSLTYNGLPTLPPGLVFNSNTGVLSGVYPPVGNYTLVYKASLSNGTHVTQSFSVRVRPAAGAPMAVGTPVWAGVVGESHDIDLSAAFSDPEAESAVRVSTNLGDMDFILFDTATPATVANFMNYVVTGKYADVVFHRSVSDFVIQGGGFKGTGTGSNFTSVVTSPPVVNEPGVANTRGTIAMAKLGGDADSATSQFFVNTGDNRANLDFQNGGFTVFGRVAGNGMVVADAINDLPNRTYNLFVDGSNVASEFSNFPMNAASAPSSMDQTKLAKINSVTPIPTMVFSVSGNTNPSVATASVIGGQLHIEGLGIGHTTITVTATDLDHLTNTQTVEVDLSETFASWISRSALAGDQSGSLENPDGDALNNLLEYAFLEDPAVFNPGPLPVAGTTGDSPEDEYMTLAFPLRKFTSGLSYVVEGADALDGSWSAVWSSADGFEHPQVLEVVDLEDRMVVKIKDSIAIGVQPQRFLRARVVQE